MPVKTRTHVYNVPVIETRTGYKVVDHRSLGEKAKDALRDAAHSVKEVFAPEVKNKDIAKAADKKWEHEKKELKYAEKANKKAAKIAHLQQKQAQQHAEKCAHAMKRHGHGGIAFTHVTEIH